MDTFRELLTARVMEGRYAVEVLRNQLAQAIEKLEAYEKVLAAETGAQSSTNGNGLQESAIVKPAKRRKRQYGPTKVNAVFDVIKAHPGLVPAEMFALIPKNVISALGMKREQVYHGLQKLRLNGRVEQDDEGRYFPAGSMPKGDSNKMTESLNLSL